MDTADAIRELRADPAYADLIRDAYLDEDPRVAAERYAASDEAAEVRRLLAPRGKRILDVGAGNGIASVALAHAGASVIAIDPDPGTVVGLGALRVATAGMDVRPVAAAGEALPIAGGSMDAVFARQVLHHARDLHAMIAECMRVLRPGGRFIATREHVVDDAAQLEVFLAGHPVHRLAGGEHAFSLGEYVRAIVDAGLELEAVLGPLDSIINAFPAVRSTDELRGEPERRARARAGPIGGLVARLAPGWTRRRLNGRGAGRLYSFVARAPKA